MRFPFRVPPSPSGGALIPRPMVDIALDGIPGSIACLADTGAYSTRMSAALASRAAVELDRSLTQTIYVAGLATVGTFGRATLSIGEGADQFSWDAPVWFCDPWPYPFGLAGIDGFFRHFVVTVHAYDGYLDVEPLEALGDCPPARLAILSARIRTRHAQRMLRSFADEGHVAAA